MVVGSPVEAWIRGLRVGLTVEVDVVAELVRLFDLLAEAEAEATLRR